MKYDLILNKTMETESKNASERACCHTTLLCIREKLTFCLYAVTDLTQLNAGETARYDLMCELQVLSLSFTAAELQNGRWVTSRGRKTSDFLKEKYFKTCNSGYKSSSGQ